MYRPSFYGFIMNGIVLLIFIILFCQNYNKLDPVNLMWVALIASIAFGIHNLNHYWEEKIYDSKSTSQEPLTTRR